MSLRFRYSNAVGCYSRISPTSPQTRLWSFQGLSAAPPVSPNLDSALLITRLSIALAIPRLLLLAIPSAQQLYFLLLGFAAWVAPCGAVEYPNVSVLSCSRALSAASQPKHRIWSSLSYQPTYPFFKVQQIPIHVNNFSRSNRQLHEQFVN